MKLTLLGCSSEKTEFVGTIDVSFPQAVNGGLWANPDLFSEIPLRLNSAAGKTIEVTIADETYVALENSDTEYVVNISISSMDDGEHTIEVWIDGKKISVAPKLSIGRQGYRFAEWESVGDATSAQLHYLRDTLYLSWVDEKDGYGRHWLQEINSLGLGLGNPISLSPEETVVKEARAAVGTGYIASLYQQEDGSLRSWLRITNLIGTEVIAPIDLDGTSTGVLGGDLTYSDRSFYSVWRNIDNGIENVNWLRISPSIQEIQGPEIIINSVVEMEDSPSIEVIDEISMVALTKPFEDSESENIVQQNYTLVLDEEGVLQEEVALSNADQEGALTKVFNINDNFTILWSLLSPEARIFGSIIDSNEDQIAVEPTEIVEVYNEHSNLNIVHHLEQDPVLFWSQKNHSSETEIIFGSLDETLNITNSRTIPYAHLIETDQLTGINIGTNVLLVWSDVQETGDESTKSELYFETLWF
jgi:hypothetical protein